MSFPSLQIMISATNRDVSMTRAVNCATTGMTSITKKRGHRCLQTVCSQITVQTWTADFCRLTRLLSIFSKVVFFQVPTVKKINFVVLVATDSQEKGTEITLRSDAEIMANQLAHVDSSIHQIFVLQFNHHRSSTSLLHFTWLSFKYTAFWFSFFVNKRGFLGSEHVCWNWSIVNSYITVGHIPSVVARAKLSRLRYALDSFGLQTGWSSNMIMFDLDSVWYDHTSNYFDFF